MSYDHSLNRLLCTALYTCTYMCVSALREELHTQHNIHIQPIKPIASITTGVDLWNFIHSGRPG